MPDETPQYQYYYKQAGKVGRKPKAKGTGPFRDDLKKLMYGFGDHSEPNESSVGLLEVYVEEFIVNLISQTARRS